MNDSEFLPLGKLEPALLSGLIKKYTTSDESVIIGPKIGVDATVIEPGNQFLIAKTDPITFTADDIGYYAININANDIACMGGVPRWFLGTLLLPENQTTAKLVENIFHQIAEVCKELSISFCGGHTEITYGIDRPILAGQMLGTVDKEKLINNKNARAGDHILLTKGIAIEAVSIIAREKQKELAATYSSDFVEKCKQFIYRPGISVLKDALIAVEAGGVRALHDPTEGGLAMGLHELAEATGCGLKIDGHEIIQLPEAKLLCDQLNIDILGAIASGALLIVAGYKDSLNITDRLKSSHIRVKDIGKLMPAEYGRKIIIDEKEMDLPEFPQDEITKLFN